MPKRGAYGLSKRGCQCKVTDGSSSFAGGVIDDKSRTADLNTRMQFLTKPHHKKARKGRSTIDATKVGSKYRAPTYGMLFQNISAGTSNDESEKPAMKHRKYRQNTTYLHLSGA